MFDLAHKMVELSPEMQRLKLVRVIPSKKTLIGTRCNVEYRALSAEGKTAFGLSPVLAILDEVGQVEGPRDRFVSAITTSQGAYADALLLAISTQAPSDLDMFSLWLDAQKNAPDPRIVSHVYEAPEDCALDDRKAWAAANPALGIFKAISDLEQESKLAIQMPTNEPEFRNLSLNQRVETASPFVTHTVWKANGAAPTPIDGRDVFGGLDLASVHDLCALAFIDAIDGSVNCFFWLPEHGLVEKARSDLAPYDIWKRDGILSTTPGNAVEYEYIAEALRGIFDRCNVVKIGFDRYNWQHLRPWLVKANFSDDELARFVEFGQGTASMTPALREFEVKLLNAKLRHGNNPILEWNARNTRVIGSSGARKFDKEKARGRIDGMVALAEAIGVMPIIEEDKEYQVIVI